jgi:hypothetical protein
MFDMIQQAIQWQECDVLEHNNIIACGFLDIFCYDGSVLLAKVERKTRDASEQQEQQPLTRAKALAHAVTF